MADWHLEKTVSVGHIVTTLSVAFGVIWYMAGLENQVDIVRQEQAYLRQSIARVETQADFKTREITKRFEKIREEQKADSRRIEEKIDKLIERELNGAHRR